MSLPLPLELAPNPESPLWAHIAAWDRRVWASQLNWSRTSKMRPANWSDDEKADYTARIVELYSRHEELTPQEIARTAQEQAQEMNDGWTSHDELEAIFFRGIRKASIVHHFDNSDDSREVEFLSATQDVRFSLDMITRDGARQWWGGVSVPITDDKAYEDVEHPDGTWSGLSRPMSGTVPGSWDVLLMLAPIADRFAPQQTRLETQGETLQLSRVESENSVARLVLDRDDGRVLSRQQLNRATGKITWIDEVQSWRTVADVAVPERIVSYWTRDGSPENYRHLHQLESARLGADVDADVFSFPTPATVRDFRLGEKRIVEYQLEDDHLPSLAELKQLRRQQAPSRWPLVLGLSAVALGALLFRVTQRR